ncbi:MAG: hypothetical protein AB1778_06405 [Candidatus Bipolaricaulota bacterium]
MVTRCAALVAVILSLMAAGAAAADALGTSTAYAISVRLDPRTNTLSGTERVEVANDTGQPLREVLFCLLANLGAEPNPYVARSLEDAAYVRGFDPTWTKIRSVADSAGQALAFRLAAAPPTLQTYSLREGILAIELASPLPVGARTTLVVEFETKFARALRPDMAVVDGVYIWRFGWHPIVVSSASSGQFALPAARYEVELRVPAGYRAFCGADRQALVASVDGWTSVVAASDRPVRSIPIVVGKDLASLSIAVGELELEAVYPTGGESAARFALLTAERVLSLYRARFGDVIPGRVLLVTDPAPGLYGLAADGMVLWGVDVARMRDVPVSGTCDRLVEYLLAHELAHLIWGIGAGADFNAENWISEGLAEYTAVSTFENLYGALVPNVFSHLGAGVLEGLVRELVGPFNLRRDVEEYPYIDLLRAGYDEGIVKPLQDVEYLNGLTVRTYKKGYLVLRALESLVGSETMTQVLASAAQNYAGRTLSVSALEGMFAAAAGPTLPESFFDDWVFGDAVAGVAVDGLDVQRRGDAYAVALSLRAEGATLPVTLEAALSDGSAVRVIWTPLTARQTLTLETNLPVVRVTLDPDEMLLDSNRYNNHWPRRLVVDHPFRDADLPPVGRPLDAYAIDISVAGISGGFRRDHAWAVAVVPAPAFDDVSEGTGPLLAWNAIAAWNASFGRDLSASFLASLASVGLGAEREASATLDTSLALDATFFTHPETGTPGTFWAPTHRLELVFGAVGPLPDVVPYVQTIYRLDGAPATTFAAAASVTCGIPGLGIPPFASLDISVGGRLRIAPLLYLDAGISAGTAIVGSLPDDFRLAADSLSSFTPEPRADQRVALEVVLTLPPWARHAGRPILGLGHLDGLSASIFARGSLLPVDGSKALLAEAGPALTLSVSGPLGFSFHLTLGYVVPLLGNGGRPRFTLTWGHLP